MTTNSIAASNSFPDDVKAWLGTDFDPQNIERLEQFAWLLDNDRHPRSALRLTVLWGWAYEMVLFQSEANRTGVTVEYMQRGRIMRVLHPENSQVA